jgi:hypothetical protein
MGANNLAANSASRTLTARKATSLRRALRCSECDHHFANLDALVAHRVGARGGCMSIGR